MKSPILSQALLGFLRHRPRETVSLAVLLSAGLLVCTQSRAEVAATPRIGVNVLPVQAKDWVQRGGAASYQVNGANARVTLSGPATILHWNSMDVGANAKLTFDMTSATSRVLNKVDGGAYLNKTTIEGMLNANGQVYIYNPNGIIFGKGARINVNSLVASSLKIEDQRFMDGLLSPSLSPTFAIDPLLKFMPGAVVVEGERQGSVLQQAAIQAQSGGLIMLLAPEVSNAGKLSAPDGQVLLAAGSKVYLAAPLDSSMRGLRVEVGSEGLSALAAGPAVTNEVLGNIQVQRGNVSMAGLSVNQMGMVSATTSVSLNGSVYLKAQDGASKANALTAAVASHGGSLVLGEGSSISITPVVLPKDAAHPENGPETAAKSPDFKASRVELSGASVVLQKDAKVTATSGNVLITARANPGAEDLVPNSSHIEFGQGSVVDVSGSTTAELAMESNVITAELRGGELADNVLLRDSPVRGTKVRIDARKAKDGIAVANIKGYLNLVEKNVLEYTATGGTVTVTSEGGITQHAGSKINVSGGWVDYRPGYINTTKLTLGNRLFDIETAAATIAYDGIKDLANSSANFELGYREGKSAGSVQFDAPALSLKGELLGSVTRGIRQRDVNAVDSPLGAQLLIGHVTSATMDPTTGRANVGLVDQFGFTGQVRLGQAQSDSEALSLDVNALGAAGFNRISVLTAGSIDVADDLVMPAAGQLRLGAGGHLDWHASLSMPGGSVTATARDALTVSDGVLLNLAGLWQNDLPSAKPARNSDGMPNGLIATKGGHVRLYANELDVGDGVRMDVSGGAWLNTASSLAAGDAGSITLQATTLSTSLDASLRLGDGLGLSAYGVSKGGSLTLVGRHVVIGGHQQLAAQTRDAGDLFLSADIFSQGGFSSRTVSANGNLVVTPGSTITPRAQSWLLGLNYQTHAAGAMASVAEVSLLPLAGPLGQRQASSLTLRATGKSLPGDGLGVVSMGRNTAVLADPGASVTLSADQKVLVDGTVQAAGGTISLLLSAALPESSDNSYDSSRSIWLGQHARLLAPGSTERLYVNGSGIASGDLLGGGLIRFGRLGANGLEAAVGYVVAEQGSVMDVSGVHADGLRFKSGAYVTGAHTVGSSGGTIDIRAREGVLMAGQLKGSGGSADAAGGTLSVTLDREDRVGGEAFPQEARQLVLTSAGLDTVMPEGMVAGQAIVGFNGLGVVPLASFADGGFTHLKFKSQDLLSFSGSGLHGSGVLSLQAGSSIELDAPNFRVTSDATQVNISAPYIKLGNTDSRYQQNALGAVDGGATMTVAASTLDLIGRSATQGFGLVTLSASDDIRLIGSPLEDSIGAPGAFLTGNRLTLQAAQVYPTTLSSFELALVGADTTLTFVGNGHSAQPVLSAAGSLTASADHIVQGGRVLAPFGSIALQAAKDLTFESGSVTSVAGQGVVPFGTVVNGSDWTYELGGQTIVWKVKPSTDASLGELALPTKSIVAHAPVVDQQSGAVLDLSGGGALYAYEFSPGPGGSSDVLQSSGGAKNQTFAVNANYRSSVAPQDWQYGSEGLQAGDQVYLSGGNGLPAGYYTLLPAHYALMPGGWALEATTGTRDMVAQANRVNADGSMTLAGYRNSSTDGRGDTRWTGYTLSSGELIRRRSEIKVYDATTFFQAQAARLGLNVPRLPTDGGRIAFDVTTRLVLDGVTRLNGASAVAGRSAGARGSADVTAPLIEVVTERSDQISPYVQLVADDLVALGADSLLLGGTRSRGSDGEHLVVGAETVVINNNAAHPLTGSELLVAAKDTVQVNAQATLLANAPTDGHAETLLIDGSGAAADGALLRLSGGAAVAVQRNQTAGEHGRLNVARGATMSASGSTYLDATRFLQLGGELALADGSALGISAPRISLGSATPTVVDGIAFNSAALARLSRLSSLSLNSYSSMDWYGQATLGRATMDHLTLSAATLQSHGATVQLAARTLRLNGSQQGAVTGAVATGGQLTASAQTIEIGNGTLQARGFASTQLSATGDVLATGSDGRFQTEGDLRISAARISTQAGAAAAFKATGDVSLVSAAKPTALTPVALGGSLSFEGASVVSNVNVTAQAGQIVMKGEHGVAIQGGTLDAQGRAVTFGTGQAYAPAGSITLDGGAGDVLVARGAVLDLSAKGAAAGTLSVSATGASTSTVVLDGSLRGAATAATGTTTTSLPQQGSFLMDVATAPGGAGFDKLNSQLNASGFTQARQFRVRQGDLALGATGLIKAKDITLSADNGNLTVAGTLDASGRKGGSVALYAAQADGQGELGKLTLASTARILAQATEAATSAAGSTGDGGRVVLGTSNTDGRSAAKVNGGASIQADAGSLINVSGLGAQAQGGTVVLSAPRVGEGAGVDVAVSSFKAQVLGSRSTTIEGVKTYQAASISEHADSATNLDASLNGQMATQAAEFMRSQNAIMARLGRNDVQLRSGIEVRSASHLTVSVNEQSFDIQDRGWNLNTWRFGGQAGTLNLRAAGNLIIQGSVSDGFVKGDQAVSMPNWALDGGSQSWSYKLVGGADMTAANPMAVISDTVTGDVRLGFAREAVAGDTPVALVRTGTGRIDVAAGRDVVLGTVTLKDPDGDQSLDKTFGALIYTAGHASSLAPGFVAPSNLSNELYGGSTPTDAAFGVGGGGISLTAQHNVVGAPVQQLTNSWLFRQGRTTVNSDGELVFEQVVNDDRSTSTLNTAWWARTDYFGQGVATLGGGDISVTAQTGSVQDLSVSVATNAYVPGSTPVGHELVEQGGGDLTVHAGQDILGGSFYVQKGAGQIQAGGSIKAGSLKALDLAASTQEDTVYTALRTVIAAGDAHFDLSAGKDLEIETIYNPSLTRQSSHNVALGLDPNSGYFNADDKTASAVNYRSRYAQFSNFLTYGESSSVRMTSVGGDLLLSNNAALVAASGGADLPLYDYGSDFAPLFGLSTPTLQAAALTGNLSSAHGFGMAPSASGQLALMANQSVTLSSSSGLYPGIVMLDNDPLAMSRAEAPTLWHRSDFTLLRAGTTGLSAHTAGMLHAADVEPVRVVAKEGSITGQASIPASLILPKKAEIIAGQDIRDLGFVIQHNQTDDETVIQAGRDFIDTTNVSSSSPVKHVVTGAGLLSITAGRNIDLGNAFGVVTRGNLDNAYLPEGGASVVALAGVTPPSDDEEDPFEKLKRNEDFFKALVAASKLETLDSFDALIEKNFPAARVGAGDINVFGSQFKTEQGGSLDLLAPGGSVVAGLVSVPSYLQSRSPAETGIFTVRGGAIRAFVKNDFLVNQGRVFTLGGGDITMISQSGNIDAGRGTKTASSAPPPLLTTDASGNTKVDIAGSISGSGIATLRTSEGQEASNVYAVAPRGTFDAGDAGVRSTGTVDIKASVVLNAGNIAASGGVSGAVSVDTGGLAGAVAPSSAGSAADEATKQLAVAPKETMALSVEVLGYGETEESHSGGAGADDKEQERKKSEPAKKS